MMFLNKRLFLLTSPSNRCPLHNEKFKWTPRAFIRGITVFHFYYVFLDVTKSSDVCKQSTDGWNGKKLVIYSLIRPSWKNVCFIYLSFFISKVIVSLYQYHLFTSVTKPCFPVSNVESIYDTIYVKP